MMTMQFAGRQFHNAVAVGKALGMVGANAGLFADVLARTPSAAKIEGLDGTLYLDVERLPMSAEARPAFNARLAAVRPLDLAAGAVVHRPFADARPQIVPGPVAGSIESARANARQFLGKGARKTGGDYLTRASRKAAELRDSPGSTSTSTSTPMAAAPAAPASAARPVRPAGNDAASLAAAFGLDPVNAAKLAAATIPSAPEAQAAPVAAQGEKRKMSVSELFDTYGEAWPRTKPGTPERAEVQASILEFGRRNNLIA